MTFFEILTENGRFQLFWNAIFGHFERKKRPFPVKISKKVTSMTPLNIGFYMYFIVYFDKIYYFYSKSFWKLLLQGQNLTWKSTFVGQKLKTLAYARWLL